MFSQHTFRVICGAVSLAVSTVAAGAVESRFERDRAEIAAIEKALQMSASSADVIFAHDFDPSAAPSCTADRDADRLADCAETGTNKYVSASDTGTSPDRADTDGDGLLDGDEFYDRYAYSDPLDADTDNDRLSDGEEVYGLFGYVTDPYRWDTDGDGYSDRDEIYSGRNPVVAGV